MYQRLEKIFAFLARPLRNEWGRVGAEADAEPVEGQSAVGQDDPPGDGGESQSEGEPVDKYARFRGQDGNLDSERILESYKELERDHGRLGNEVGQLRQANQRWEEWANENVAPMQTGDGDIPLQWPERMQAQSQAINQDEAIKIIRDQWDANPMAVLDAYGKIVEERLVSRMARRNEAFSDPLLKEHPDVKSAAMRLSSEHGLDPEVAINIVLGQKVRNAVSQATGGKGSALQTGMPFQQTSFIQPAGTPIQSGPGRSKLSEAERNWIRTEGSKYGITSEDDYLKWKE
jgi:hypothetical protein